MAVSEAFRLDGQRALVTGGGSGLGYAISRAFVDAGARVTITGRTEESLRASCERLGDQSSWIVHDVTCFATIPGLIERVEAEAGPLDILVNNAGIHLKRPAVDTSDAEFGAVIQTHLAGSFALTREVGRRMIGRGRGSIVMILSMAALFGIPEVSAYTAAKSALLGLTRALATEMSPNGVRVNAICPGWIDSRMSRGALDDDPERKARILARTPLGRMGQPSDVGHAAVYLCSPAASFVTGVALPVDGGVSIGF